jgi:hypothetical protein
MVGTKLTDMFKSLPDRYFPPIHSFFYISRAILTGKDLIVSKNYLKD